MGPDGECEIELDSAGAPVYQDRWRSMLENMSAGDYLLIQFGINDGSRTCDRHVGEAQFQMEYGMMADAAKERGAHPVFLTPTSMIACSGGAAVGSRGFIDATFQAGDVNGVPVIDLHELSVALYNSLGFCPLPNGAADLDAATGGAVGAFFCDDHTHFDQPGAEAIAQVVVQAIQDQGIGLSAYIRE